MIVQLPHHRDTSSALMQRVPDLQKDAILILSPLGIPKAKFHNSLFFQKLSPQRILFLLLWQAMVKSIQFNGKPGGWTIEVEKK